MSATLAETARRLQGLLAQRPSVMRFVAHQVIVFVALLLVAIQVVTFVALDRTVSKNAHEVVRDEIAVGHKIFHRLLDDRAKRLTTATSVLTSDFGLRQAVLSGDRATVVSALANHGSRVGATQMTLVDLDRRVIGDTLASAAAAGEPFALPELLVVAERAGTASAVAVADGVAYQFVVVPMLAPAPVAWVVTAFRVDGELAHELGLLTDLEVSFAVWERARGWKIAASTMSASSTNALLQALGPVGPEQAGSIERRLDADDRLASASTLARDDDAAVVAVLQRSLQGAIARFDELRAVLVALAAFSLCATLAGSVAIARSISKPVSELADFARRIEHGDYEQGPPQTRSDELGELAAVFNRMRLAIAGREQQIKALALQDALTGLPNRALFNERLQQALGVARRVQHPASVLLIDLNRFKEVNDTLGHHVGDRLLIEVADRLRAALTRESDTPARLGGDEFAVLLPATNAVQAESAARRILLAFDLPVVVDGRRLDISGSIGIAAFPDHATDANVLMSRADAAMYVAKRRHLGWATYETRFDTDTDSHARLTLCGELREALEHDELVLYYQPRLALHDGRVAEVEALVRWQHPTRGVVPPNEFVPFAEQTGCIREITHRIVDRAFEQGARWHAAGLALSVSVNLSARDLVEPDLPERVAELLRRRGALASWFRFEITESAIIDDPVRALDTVARLHAMGFTLSIDDFGTGYSSLSQLKRLPVAELKIDRSFVMDMAHDAEDLAIVRSVVDLAHNMALAVVAEGVETEAVIELLRKLGCDTVQGYYICQPLPADRLERWLARYQPGRPNVTPIRRVV